MRYSYVHRLCAPRFMHNPKTETGGAITGPPVFKRLSASDIRHLTSDRHPSELHLPAQRQLVLEHGDIGFTATEAGRNRATAMHGFFKAVGVSH